MNQRDLFEAFARKSDPRTSHDAARSIDHDVARLEMIVFMAVKASMPMGLTWDEAAPRTGLDKASISPRWKPLRKKGLIKEATDETGNIIKRKGKSGRSQIVWVTT